MASDDSSTIRISHSALGFRPSHICPQPKIVKHLKISPNGKLLGVSDVEGLLRVWSLERSAVILTVGTESQLPEEGSVVNFCWAQPYTPPFDVGLVCAYEGGKMQTIEYRGTDPKDGAERWNSGEAWEAHEGEIMSLSVDRSNTYITSVTNSQLRLWYLGPSWKTTLLATDSLEFEAGGRILPDSFFSGPCIYMPIASRVIRTWVIDLEGVRLTRAGDIKVPFDLRGIFVSPDERSLIALRRGGGGHLYSLPDFKHTKAIFGAYEKIDSLSFVYGHNAVLYSDRSGVIRLRDLSTVKDIGLLTHHRGKSIAGAVAASMQGTSNIVVSATISAAPLDPSKVMVWTDSISVSPAASDFAATMRMNSRRTLLVIVGLRFLFVFSALKIAYDFGIIVEQEKIFGSKSGFWSCLLVAVGRFVGLVYGYSAYCQVALIGGLFWLGFFLPSAF
ncbi:hypothetical protein SISSUDRAFT_1132754 [Sistotremastrum suecicum HHB10207 ss-3]|uniref:WD40 repeat-like protein n=1 Tax=Sistotremastrum suecicum HHB10207 ss-3 TaxID=1314776 RepID=A0A165YCR8_9AGAM|nr:hypothetical protein SISSUDRAFT_1132754 [Sistotremastrum suecicum HHB10207 ss-3]